MTVDNKAWLGDLPNQWNVKNIGNLYVERKEKTNKEDFPLSVTKNGVMPQLSYVVKSELGSERKIVKQGDYVINSRSDRRGSCGIAPNDGTCSLINTVIYGVDNVDYYNYLLQTEYFANEFYRWGHGIAADLWTTKWREMKKIVVPDPPLDYKKTVVNFLDLECKNIDYIISEEEKSVKLYKELSNKLIEKYIFGSIKNC